jgi:hypothetical protein
MLLITLKKKKNYRGKTTYIYIMFLNAFQLEIYDI